MSSYLTKDFVEKRITTFKSVPPDWDAGRGHFYQLELRMCQLGVIKYGFRWGDESKPLPKVSSIVEQPSRILKLDISLNDLPSLEYDALYPLRNLRLLDASLNRIERFDAVEILSHLRYLNLAHNFIKSIDGLEQNSALVELNLSMNEITDIAAMPSLVNLTVLHLNNNKLKSLDGIQSLSKLRELYVQRNELQDLVALSSSRNLAILNAAENNLHAFQATVDILKTMMKLQSLCLYGNPLESEKLYQQMILEHTSILSLDNVGVRPVPRAESRPTHPGNMISLKNSAKQAFQEQLKAKKKQVDENVHFLKQRIVAIQDEYQAYEEKMKRDLENCLGYLDTLSLDEAQGYDDGYFRESISSPVPKPWDQSWKNTASGSDLHHPHIIRRDKPDYSSVTRTDEILRLATNELTRQQAKMDSW